VSKIGWPARKAKAIFLAVRQSAFATCQKTVVSWHVSFGSFVVEILPGSGEWNKWLYVLFAMWKSPKKSIQENTLFQIA
jgi:hypothetical protein